MGGRCPLELSSSTPQRDSEQFSNLFGTTMMDCVKAHGVRTIALFGKSFQTWNVLVCIATQQTSLAS